MKIFPPGDLEEPASLLDAGEIVAIPTDTVYGFAARLDRPGAVRRLFQVKTRPESAALPVLVASLDQARALLGGLDPVTERLGRRFWPGGLTIVTSCSRDVGNIIGSKDDTAGIRVPNDDVALRLLGLSGPLAVSSANRHGEPPCTNAQDVVTVLGESSEVAGVVDAGLRNGKPSTVVRVVGAELHQLRSGPLSIEELSTFLSSAI